MPRIADVGARVEADGLGEVGGHPVLRRPAGGSSSPAPPAGPAAAASATPRCREPLIAVPPRSDTGSGVVPAPVQTADPSTVGMQVVDEAVEPAAVAEGVGEDADEGREVVHRLGERGPVAGQDVGDRDELLQRRGERLAVVGDQARRAAPTSSWVLVRIESISSRRSCTSVSRVLESTISWVNSPLRSASTWVTFRVADSSCAQLRVARGDGVREPGQALQRGADLVRGVGERLGQHLEARGQLAVSMSSTVDGQVGEGLDDVVGRGGALQRDAARRGRARWQPRGHQRDVLGARARSRS